MTIVTHDQTQLRSLGGNHIATVANGSLGARQVEMWRGHMDAGAATPPHLHDTEEVVLFLAGNGHATVDGVALRFGAGDTLVLPAGKVHQLFADTRCEFVAAMPLGGTISLPDGQVMDLPWREGA